MLKAGERLENRDVNTLRRPHLSRWLLVLNTAVGSSPDQAAIRLAAPPENARAVRPPWWWTEEDAAPSESLK
jgi:hypothetical protein